MNSKQIADDVNNISLEATENQNELCNIWPTVKQGLEILKGIIKNPIVKFTIGGLITAGDAIVGKVCK